MQNDKNKISDLMSQLTKTYNNVVANVDKLESRIEGLTEINDKCNALYPENAPSTSNNGFFSFFGQSNVEKTPEAEKEKEKPASENIFPSLFSNNEEKTKSMDQIKEDEPKILNEFNKPSTFENPTTFEQPNAFENPNAFESNETKEPNAFENPNAFESNETKEPAAFEFQTFKQPNMFESNELKEPTTFEQPTTFESNEPKTFVNSEEEENNPNTVYENEFESKEPINSNPFETKEEKSNISDFENKTFLKGGKYKSRKYKKRNKRMTHKRRYR